MNDLESALKKIVSVSAYSTNAFRVSIPKALGDQFVAQHGVNARWEVHERGLLLTPAMHEPNTNEAQAAAWTMLRVASHRLVDLGCPLLDVLKSAQKYAKEAQK